MKKVLLLPDIRGWAYDIIAKNILIHGDKSKYDISIKYVSDVLRGSDSVDFNDYDVVYAFFWYDMHIMEGKHYKNFDRKKVAVGVHGINSWEKRRIAIPDVKNILNKYAAVGGISKEICGILNGCNILYTPSGFSERHFKVRHMPKMDPLKILWVGDPDTRHHGDIKGYNEFIVPVIKRSKGVELITASKKSNIKYEDMSKFYEKGHVLLCMSKTEGSPLPVIEAMACGRPIISTSVGIVPEVVDGNNGIIIPRTADALYKAIDDIKKMDVVKMGNLARKSIRPRTWGNVVAHYEDLFEEVG